MPISSVGQGRVCARGTSVVSGIAAAGLLALAATVFAAGPYRERPPRVPDSRNLMPEPFTSVFLGMTPEELLAVRPKARVWDIDKSDDAPGIECRKGEPLCLENNVPNSFYPSAGYLFEVKDFLTVADFGRDSFVKSPAIYRDMPEEELEKAVTDAVKKYGKTFRRRVLMQFRGEDRPRYPLLYLFWEKPNGNVTLVFELTPVATRTGAIASPGGDAISLRIHLPGFDPITYQDQAQPKHGLIPGREEKDPAEVKFLFDQNLPFLDDLLAEIP